MAELEPEVKNFEPHMALTPGGDGLESYRIIAGSLEKFLNPNGIGLFEIGASQGLDVLNIFAENGFAHSKIFQDLDGRDRVVKVIAK